MHADLSLVVQTTSRGPLPLQPGHPEAAVLSDVESRRVEEGFPAAAVLPSGSIDPCVIDATSGSELSICTICSRQGRRDVRIVGHIGDGS